MKNLKLLPILLLLLTFVVSSCDDTDDGMVDRLARSEWETDLGKKDNKIGEPLYSVFTFNYNGTGVEYLYYYDDEFYDKIPYRWRLLHNEYFDAIELSYREGSEFLDEIRFGRNRMEAIHYYNRYDFERKREGMPIILDEVYPRQLFD